MGHQGEIVQRGCFSARLQGINLTGRVMRSHGRALDGLEYVTPNGCRFMFGGQLQILKAS